MTIAGSIIWLVACVALGLSGKVKINDQGLPPLLGAIVAPFLMLFIGAIFLLCGAALCAPLLLLWGR